MLHLAVARHCDEPDLIDMEMVKILTEERRGVEVNVLDTYGLTPFGLAVRGKNLEAVKHLWSLPSLSRPAAYW